MQPATRPHFVASVPAIVAKLETLGVPPAALIASDAPHAQWQRTAKMARAVREKINALGLKPRGINVLTEGTHARETWAAFRHMFAGDPPVGIISIPKSIQPGYRWWASNARARIQWPFQICVTYVTFSTRALLGPNRGSESLYVRGVRCTAIFAFLSSYRDCCCLFRAMPTIWP